ncbi:Fe(3+)-hydroxamate ABC transporter permease FhuB [Allosediminivita pacifica]|uniref:Iron complex transport system permease protein n=1 Tax=Allosediminivita pacifica TaxID=1267769 RepID=A0A2T6AJJ7_9RHOB|nr:Fe(3+)-hydroxamate ABC transporter permease FhuB [Allosediminivita pacifica]PTX43977.1 iron complex transport system permease protein [Allosediminivita pacifica]GGB21214.1 Fe3+-hydroxamate ABC transporter permease FhuB [Allosediminivita pacifica]
MTRALPLGGAALLALALWFHAAGPWLSDGWPLPPWDARSLDLDGILLVYGHLPRGVIALLAGAALGLSGALLQAVLRNPIADPSTLGISSGAQLALVAVTVLAPECLAWGRWPVAMGGATAALALVMGIGAARAFHPVTMIIAGMLIGLFASSMAAALTLAQGEYLFSLVVWNGGSLVQTSWGPALSLTAVLALGGIGAALLARPLGVLGIEAASAQALGLNVARLRALAVILATILAASVSAAVGLVAFVGLAAPALARALGARTQAQRLALAPVCGALLLSLCDGLVLGLAGAGGEMFPTGAVTGLIGGPLLLWLLPRLRATPPPAQEENLPRLSRPAPLLAGLTALTLVLLVLLTLLGRTPEGWTLLDAETARLFLPNRLPRLAGAACAGGLLALAGAVLQRLTGNPLASPEVLGVSGGAAMGYAAVLFTLAAPSALLLTGGAAAGGATALAVILLFVLGRNARPERLLLAGIAVSALAAALLSVLMAAGTTKSFAVLAWLSGSALTMTPAGATALAATLAVLMALSLTLSRWLTLLPLGPQVARALGVPVTSASVAVVALAGIATGAATILVGPLSFVGLMAPHLARRLGLARAPHHLAGSALIGALLMLAADFGARMASFPYDLPLGLFASLLGAPWLTWLMLRRPS